mmetsp:Transcript_55172/g.162186  ORF Transcript_55172/g.162186 Transcript_55172/m.162186 type:complete len:325 (-) Transcript_55172:91-1065(-)
MNAALLASGGGDQIWDTIKGPLKGIAMVSIAALGTVFSGMLGSVLYPTPPGMGMISGCLIGFLIFSSLGCCMTGLMTDMLKDNMNPNRLNVKNAMPHWALMKSGFGHGEFELIFTIHQVVNVAVLNKLPWQWLYLYVEVDCGDNPVKTTRVKTDWKFHQQFKLKIRPTDEQITLTLKDQDIFGSTAVGVVCVDIMRDIIEANFPKGKLFDIKSGDSYSLRHVEGDGAAAIYISFDYTDAYPKMVTPDKNLNELHAEKTRFYHASMLDGKANEAEGDPYGTFAGKEKNGKNLTLGQFMKKMPVFNPGTRNIGHSLEEDALQHDAK